MSVASSAPWDAQAWHTNYWSWIEIASPWVQIASTLEPGNETYCWWSNYIAPWYGMCQWTSMASPVAASLAWLLAGTPKGQWLSNIQIKDIIMDTADPVWRQWGAWRINVCAAVAAIWYPCLDYATPVKPEPSCTDGVNDQDNEESGQTWNTVPAPECDDPTCDVADIRIDSAGMCSTWVMNPVIFSLNVPDSTSDDSKWIKYERTTSPDVWSSNSNSFTVNPPLTEDITVTVTVKNCFDNMTDCLEFCEKTATATIEVFSPDAISEWEDPAGLIEEQCHDNKDNDCDGLIDCEESACTPYCGICSARRDGLNGNPWPHNDACGDLEPPWPWNPDPGVDCNDCSDPSCDAFPRCGKVECDCCDNIDNDGDGLSDYFDVDCCAERATDCSWVCYANQSQACSNDTECTGVDFCVCEWLLWNTPLQKYSCNGDSCVADANWSYTSSNCNNECANTCNTDNGDECETNSDCGSGEQCNDTCACEDAPAGWGFTMFDISEPRCGPCRSSATALNSNTDFQDMINSTNCDIEIHTQNQTSNWWGDGQWDRFTAFAWFVADHSIYPRGKDPMTSSIPHARIEDENGNVVFGPTNPGEAENYLMQNCQ